MNQPLTAAETRLARLNSGKDLGEEELFEIMFGALRELAQPSEECSASMRDFYEYRARLQHDENKKAA